MAHGSQSPGDHQVPLPFLRNKRPNIASLHRVPGIPELLLQDAKPAKPTIERYVCLLLPSPTAGFLVPIDCQLRGHQNRRCKCLHSCH